MSQAQRVDQDNLSNIEKNSIDFVKSKGIDYALLATTQTMKNKKITDATKVISDYLTRSCFHNYAKQDFGSKVTRKVYYRTESANISSKGTFYRAGSRGDKRLNLSGFWDFSDGNEVNMLIVHDEILNVINVSKINLKNIWEEETASQLKEFLNAIINPRTIPLFDTNELEDIKRPDQYAIEGIIKELKILARSRNKKIADKRKELDQFECKACGFHYKDKIVECHHLNPLSIANENVISLDGLITLCPTCHAIAHQLLRDDPLMNTNVDSLLKNLKEILTDIDNN